MGWLSSVPTAACMRLPDTSDCVPTCAAMFNLPSMPSAPYPNGGRTTTRAAVRSQLRAFIIPPSPGRISAAGAARAECSVYTIARNMASRAGAPCALAAALVALAWAGSDSAERAGPRAGKGAEAGPRPAPLLLPRDVPAPGHERGRLARLVPGRQRARGLDRGRALARRARFRPRPAAHERSRLRLPARLVARRATARLRLLPRRRGRAARARARERPELAAARRTARSTSSRAGRPTAGAWPSSRPRYEGRFHVFLLDAPEGQPGAARRLTEDRDSRPAALLLLALRPVPLADVVARRQRAAARLESRPHLGQRRPLAHEGGAGRAAACWSTTRRRPGGRGRTGRATAGASSTRRTLGRQWHQLWLVPAEGGDPFPLTYGEFDATAPRWSPDAHAHRLRLERGRRAGALHDRACRAASAGASSDPRAAAARARSAGCASTSPRTACCVPARVSVTTPDGRSFVPEGAWRHADDSYDRAERRIEYGYFHTTGRRRAHRPGRAGDGRGHARPRVPAGAARARGARGGACASVRVALERLADWPSRGWWSGDLHVHMNYGGRLSRDARSRCARWPRPRTCTWSST